MSYPIHDELCREDVKIRRMEKNKVTLLTRYNDVLYFSLDTPFEDNPFSLPTQWVTIESFGDDWMVFRDNQEKVYLLLQTKESESIFSTINFEKYEPFNRKILSSWQGAKIYGYCGGFFDRDHYGVHEHTIEVVGYDWIVARDTDEEKGRVYLAHFDGMHFKKMDDYLTHWSSEEEKQLWDFPDMGE